MKKLLSILAAVGLTATSATTVVACGGSSTKKDNDDTPKRNTDINTVSASFDTTGMIITVKLNGKLQSDLEDSDITVQYGLGGNAPHIEIKAIYGNHQGSDCIKIYLGKKAQQGVTYVVNIQNINGGTGNERVTYDAPQTNKGIEISKAVTDQYGNSVYINFTKQLIADIDIKDIKLWKNPNELLKPDSVAGNKVGSKSVHLFFNDKVLKYNESYEVSISSIESERIGVENNVKPETVENSEIYMKSAVISEDGKILTVKLDHPLSASLQDVSSSSDGSFKFEPSTASLESSKGTQVGSDTITISFEDEYFVKKGDKCTIQIRGLAGAAGDYQFSDPFDCINNSTVS